MKTAIPAGEGDSAPNLAERIGGQSAIMVSMDQTNFVTAATP